MGYIKILLASLLGVSAREEILQKARLFPYVVTAVNDPELFSTNRGQMWGALRDVFPTRSSQKILIEPLGQQENLRAYVSRALQVWRKVTGYYPSLNQMEQTTLQAKIQKGIAPVGT